MSERGKKRGEKERVRVREGEDRNHLSAIVKGIRERERGLKSTKWQC